MAYYDIVTGEELDDIELHRRYDDMLDDCAGDVAIGLLSYSASAVLKAVDPIAYRVGFSEYLDAELGETITESLEDVE